MKIKDHAIWVAKTLGLTLLIAGPLSILIRYTGKEFTPYVFSLVLAGLILRKVLTLLAGPKETVPAPIPGRGTHSYLVPRRPFASAAKWENRLSWTSGDPDRFDTAVRTRLRELADVRLHRRHGFTIDGDPARAHAVLGQPLWNFLHHKVAVTPNPAQLDWFVARIEEI